MDKAEMIVAALRLARERVTGDDVRWKRERKQELMDLEARTALYDDVPDAEGRPTASELREILGNPDDKALREALDAWG